MWSRPCGLAGDVLMKNQVNDKTYILKSIPDLYNVTFDMFSKKTFDLASLNDIIKLSKTNKGSFYYRFSDKKQLYFGLVDDLFNQQNIIFSEQIKTHQQILSIRQMTTIVFLNSLKLNQIDSRYVDLLRLVYCESPELLKEIQTHCIHSLYDDYRLFILSHLISEQLCDSTEVGTCTNYLTFTFTNLKAILGEDFSESGIEILINKIFDGFSIKESVSTNISPVLKMSEVTYDFPNQTKALNDISLLLNSHEIVAIVGKTKSGKSTFQRLLAQVYQTDKGKIEYLSEGLINAKKRSNAIGFTFDKPCLFNKMTVRQNLNYYARIYRRKADIPSLLEQLSLSTFENVKVEQLTDSQKIKVNLLRSIINQPKLLLIDDMLKGFSFEDKQQIFQMMLKIRASGSTIVMTTSLMSEALSIADRIGFLVEGKLISIQSTAVLRAKYDQKSLIVQYLEAGLVNKEVVPFEEINGIEFARLIKTKKIISISTKATLDNEIFKNETGVEL
jgi:ABC-type multidrug transport system ATPase subunit